MSSEHSSLITDTKEHWLKTTLILNQRFLVKDMDVLTKIDVARLDQVKLVRNFGPSHLGIRPWGPTYTFYGYNKACVLYFNLTLKTKIMINLPDHQWPNQRDIQGTIMYHYHQCDRQHSLQLDMGNMMLYNMRHNRHSNRTNHFEILHYPLNKKIKTKEQNIFREPQSIWADICPYCQNSEAKVSSILIILWILSHKQTDLWSDGP